MSYLAKRATDIAGAMVGLIVLSPALLLTAVAIRLRMGSPVLFRQPRAGLHGTVFSVIKFRTMTGGPIPGREAENDHIRLTGLGRLLRRLSIDELPQLWCVLVGDMSLVGPRPLLVDYLPLYSSSQAVRHDAKPGITGWAQINGRNALDWESRLAMDAWYVQHASFRLDTVILLRTVYQMVIGTGTSVAQHVTTPRFTGTVGSDMPAAHSEGRR